MNQNPPPAWLPLLFVVVFPAFWCVVVYVISVIGGWRQLAKRFRCPTAVTGTTWRSQSAGICHYSESGYRRCLNVTANEEGIGLSVLFLFRVGHPPLFIPWADILVRQVKRFFFFNRVRLTISEEPSVWLEFSPKLAGKIQKAIGQEWFEEG